MKCEALTLFPGIVAAALSESIVKRAVDKGLLDVRITDLRDFTHDRHKTADDSPFGGGPGMVMKPEPIFEAVDSIKARGEPVKVILMSPQGTVFGHKKALELAGESRRLLFICGRYEGVDDRVRQALVDEELSIGDFVLSGGELAAAVVIEACARLIPGVLGDDESAEKDSFYEGLLDYPHYTRPAAYRGMAVPETLLSGNHEQIRRWRRREALKATLTKRPDLLFKLDLSPEDKKLLDEIESNMWQG
jgi:tRNA (guanine37-N1)-methyltransferase